MAWDACLDLTNPPFTQSPIFHHLNFSAFCPLLPLLIPPLLCLSTPTLPQLDSFLGSLPFPTFRLLKTETYGARSNLCNPRFVLQFTNAHYLFHRTANLFVFFFCTTLVVYFLYIPGKLKVDAM